ncbi:MAG: carbohydrate ABC transporter permease [Sphaerochaetaceae bacterium]
MSSSMNKVSLKTRIISYIILILFTVITIFPFIWMTYSSFKLKGAISMDPLGLPKNPTLANYQKAFKFGHMGISFLNSLIYSSISTAGAVMLSVSIGFALTKFKYRSAKIFMGFFTMGLLITVNSVITPLFIMETTIGIYNTYLGVILPYIAFGLPMAVLISCSFIRGIPNSLIEAAIIDGSTYIQIFWKIIVPISTPVIATNAVLNFLGNWNEFLMVFTLTSGQEKRSLPVTINSFAGRLVSDYGLQFSALVIGTIPMFIFYILLHDKLLAGFGEGAIKE